MSDPVESGPARKAYEAYREVLGDPQNVAGESYRWQDMPRRVQEAFRAAAHAGAMHYANGGLGRVGQRCEHAGFEGEYIACPACGGHGLLILGDDGDEMRSPVAVDHAKHGRTAMEQKINPASGNPVPEDSRPGQRDATRWRPITTDGSELQSPEPATAGLGRVDVEAALKAQESMPVDVEPDTP